MFPVVTVKFEYLMEKYGLRYILTEDSYLADIERIDVKKELKVSLNGFHIFELLR